MTGFKKLLALALVAVGAIGLAGCAPTEVGLSDLEQLGEALLEVNLATETSSDLTFPTTGLHDVVITWESSNPDIIANDGTVTRPTFTEGNQVVTITASLTLGDDTLTKTFEVTVLAATEKTDAERLDEAKTALLIPVTGLVLSDITLPETALDATVVWASSNEAVITNDGVVTRPANGEGNAVVTLTATLTVGDEVGTKDFEVTVREEEPSNVFDSIPAMHESSVLGDIVEFQGIVVGIFNGGYFLSDGTYSLGVYNPGTTLGVEVGDEVYVKGSYAVYNTLFQIGSVTDESIVSSDNANPLTAATLTVGDLLALDSSDPLIHGMLYQITGTIELRGDYDNIYIVDGEDAVLIYYYSLEASLDALTAQVGKVVTITVLYYTDHATNGPMVVFDGGDADIDIATLSDVDALAADIAAIGDLVPSVTVDSVMLPEVGPNGTIFSGWASSDTAVLGNDGTFVALGATTTTITFTATATKGTEVGVATVDVVVPILSTVAEVNAMDAGASFQVTGVVYEETYYGFFIHLDGSYAFVYAQDLVDSVEPGQEITILGFLGEYSGLKQINVVEYTLGTTGNDLVDPIEGTVADLEDDVIARGTIVTVTGTITIEGTYNDVYVTGAEGGKVKVYYRSNASELVGFEGQVVVLDLIGYQDGTVLFNGVASDVEIYTLSDADALAADLAVVGVDVPSITVSDVTLPVSGENGTVYTVWTSSDATIMGNDGTFVAVGASTTTVTFTAVATNGTAVGTATIEVVVPVASTVAQVLDMNKGDNFQVTGVVYEETYYGFFIHADGNYIFVYDNTILDAVAPGDEITILGYLGYYSGLTQVNVVSYTLGTAGNDLVDPVVGAIGAIQNDLVARGTIVTVIGTVSIEGSYNNIYLTGPAGGKVVVYYRSNASELTSFEGQIITLDIISYQDETVLFNGAAADVTVETAFTDAQKAADAVAVIDLGDVNAVADDLTLPTTDTPTGATIAWATSDAAVVTDAGIITATIGADTYATLTATVTVGVEVVTREFAITVLDANDSVPLSVNEALLLTDGDSVLVTGVITGEYYDERIIQSTDGAAIWINSDVAGDIGDEIIVRGTLATYDSNGNNARRLDGATLVETVSVGNALVVDAETDPEVIVTEFAEMRTYTATLTVDSFDSYGYVFFDTGAEAMKLKFSFNHYAPYFEDVYAVGDTVVVTFTILDVSYSNVRLVNVVLPELTDAQNLVAAKGALTVPEIAVTDIDLATTNDDYNATISWASDNAAITTGGVVTRPAAGAGDVAVVLTATVTVGALSENVVFNVTVSQEVAAPTQDLFFSEYGEPDGGSCKYLEIYNPTDATVDLSNYKIINAYNGNAWDYTNVVTYGYILPLVGSLPAGETYVIYNEDCVAGDGESQDATISSTLFPTNLTNALGSTSSAVGFNGDDTIGLFNGDVLIDVIGQIEEDPGSSWAIGNGDLLGGTTANVIMVRVPTVTMGELDWSIGAMQWIVSTDDRDYSTVGNHTYTPAS